MVLARRLRAIGQEPLDLIAAHLPRMVLAVEEDDSTYPGHVRLLGTQALVLQPQSAPNLGKQPWLLLRLMVWYAPTFACVNHYAHRFDDMQRTLIDGATVRQQASG